MTQLLVSVRNPSEARDALTGGADVIDIKEPAHGSLGAALPTVWREVLAVVGEERPVSLALGELLEYHPAPIPPEIRFVKLGLARCCAANHWRQTWEAAVRSLPAAAAPIAVAYADHGPAGAPAPEAVLSEAIRIGCRGLLVDTYEKTDRGLFDLLSESQLRELISTSQAAGVMVALAGSLDHAGCQRAARLGADLVAVRGAVCRGSRTGQVDPGLVRELRLSLPNVAEESASEWNEDT